MAIQTNDPPVIAKEDAIVRTDVNGGIVERVVLAGKVVPPDLVDDYREQHGKEVKSGK